MISLNLKASRFVHCTFETKNKTKHRHFWLNEKSGNKLPKWHTDDSAVLLLFLNTNNRVSSIAATNDATGFEYQIFLSIKTLR